jgi:outer membrane lipoprotein-sorting protein
MKIEKPLTSAMKIYIPDVSPDPKNEPFNTIYGQTGTGIFRYKDLPGTFKGILRDYSFSHIENLSKSQNIIISGTERPGQINSDMNDVDKELRDYIDQSTQFCKLWVSKDTGLVSAYFLGKSEERPTMHTEIEYISVNEKLPKDIFTYIPPEDVIVHDATSSILKKMRQHNNN